MAGDWEIRAYAEVAKYFPRLQDDPDIRVQSLVSVSNMAFKATAEAHNRWKKLLGERRQMELEGRLAEIPELDERIETAEDNYYDQVENFKNLLLQIDRVVSAPTAPAAPAPAAPAPASAPPAVNVPEILTPYVAELERAGRSDLRESLDNAARVPLSRVAEARLETLISSSDCTPERREIMRRIKRRVVRADLALPPAEHLMLIELERAPTSFADFQRRLQDLADINPASAVMVASYHQDDMGRAQIPAKCAQIAALARTVLRRAAARLSDSDYANIQRMRERWTSTEGAPDPEPLGAPPAVVAGGRWRM